PCTKDEECCSDQMCVWGQCTVNATRGTEGTICQGQSDCMQDLCCAFQRELLFPVCNPKPGKGESCLSHPNLLRDMLAWDQEGPRDHCPCADYLQCQPHGRGSVCGELLASCRVSTPSPIAIHAPAPRHTSLPSSSAGKTPTFRVRRGVGDPVQDCRHHGEHPRILCWKLHRGHAQVKIVSRIVDGQGKSPEPQTLAMLRSTASCLKIAKMSSQTLPGKNHCSEVNPQPRAGSDEDRHLLAGNIVFHLLLLPSALLSHSNTMQLNVLYQRCWHWPRMKHLGIFIPRLSLANCDRELIESPSTLPVDYTWTH
ncbi:dickkopf-related protein 3, partial [Lates japonicus]